MRFFILVGLVVGVIAVFAPDEAPGSCVRSCMASAGGSVTRSPTAFSATDARASAGG